MQFFSWLLVFYALSISAFASPNYSAPAWKTRNLLSNSVEYRDGYVWSAYFFDGSRILSGDLFEVVDSNGQNFLVETFVETVTGSPGHGEPAPIDDRLYFALPGGIKKVEEVDPTYKVVRLLGHKNISDKVRAQYAEQVVPKNEPTRSYKEILCETWLKLKRDAGLR